MRGGLHASNSDAASDCTRCPVHKGWPARQPAVSSAATTNNAAQQQHRCLPAPLQVDVLLWQPLNALERVHQAMKLAAQPEPSGGPATSVKPQLWLQCRAQVSPCFFIGPLLMIVWSEQLRLGSHSLCCLE